MHLCSIFASLQWYVVDYFSSIDLCYTTETSMVMHVATNTYPSSKRAYKNSNKYLVVNLLVCNSMRKQLCEAGFNSNWILRGLNCLLVIEWDSSSVKLREVEFLV